MNIVLDEHEWAKEMIESHTLGKKPFETLSRVAKYYIDQNYSKREVRKMLNIFLLQCDPVISLPKWSAMIEYALQRAVANDTIKIDFIEITKPELDKINEVVGVQSRRLAFTLLCLSKYYDIINKKDGHWVNCKDSDIMRMANINTSIKRQSQMYAGLRDAGLLQFSRRVDNTNVRVCFAEPGEVEMKISDFRNLGYQYLMHSGYTGYIQCKSCGLVVRKNTPPKSSGSKESKQRTVGRPQLYCPKCAASIRAERKIRPMA